MTDPTFDTIKALDAWVDTARWWTETFSGLSQETLDAEINRILKAHAHLMPKGNDDE